MNTPIQKLKSAGNPQRVRITASGAPDGRLIDVTNPVRVVSGVSMELLCR